MSLDLPSFQQYQLAFTRHLRNPELHASPADVSAEGIAVYEEIVFNNLYESVSACFPVARKVLSEQEWITLTRGFLREHSANSPIFREIPEEFLSYLANQENLPPYLYSLCHYEWIELAVSMMDATVHEDIEPAMDLFRQSIVLNPAMQLLNYNYDVQNISPEYKPAKPTNTYFLVYRNAEDIVKFVELNSVTHKLIALLQEGMTGQQALGMISKELGAELENLIPFGLEILENFKRQGIILGVHKN